MKIKAKSPKKKKPALGKLKQAVKHLDGNKKTQMLKLEAQLQQAWDSIRILQDHVDSIAREAEGWRRLYKARKGIKHNAN